jgi:hypothetical protein
MLNVPLLHNQAIQIILKETSIDFNKFFNHIYNPSKYGKHKGSFGFIMP